MGHQLCWRRDRSEEIEEGETEENEILAQAEKTHSLPFLLFCFLFLFPSFWLPHFVEGWCAGTKKPKEDWIGLRRRTTTKKRLESNFG